MKRKIVAANWKMNMLRSDAAGLLNAVISGVDFPLGCDVIIAPPYTSLDVARNILSGTDLELGAQDVFWELSGAYTGEVSPSMLIDAGCDWVIIGHSERRAIFGETDDIIKKKVEASLRTGLKVILCVGETLEQRNSNEVSKILSSQIEGAVKDIDKKYSTDVVFAYEPVWAIGTGKNATSGQIEAAHKIIMDDLIAHFEKDAHNIRILYGGSVKEDNIKEILSIRNVDGVLVGGASLDSDSFVKIIEYAGV